MASVLTAVPLNPLLTGPIWYLLTRAPTDVREPVLQWLQNYLSTEAIGTAATVFKWLFALGATTSVHNFLTGLAQNNWRISSQTSRYYWPNERAVITGAAGGFGALIAKGLVEKGVEIIAIDIAEELPADMKNNKKIHYYRCDITNRQAIMDLAARVRKEHGDPSILINNAGVAYTANLLSASESHVRRTFEVNAMAHWWTLAAWLPGMISAKKGHVVTVASVASFVPLPTSIAYASTKAAVMSLHEGIQAETRTIHQAPEIMFSIVHPSFAATGMTKPFEEDIKRGGLGMMKAEVVSDAVVKQILSCKAGRIILPESLSIASTVRAWPTYMSHLISRAMESGHSPGEASVETGRFAK